jgi:hypothetical protein
MVRSLGSKCKKYRRLGFFVCGSEHFALGKGSPKEKSKKMPLVGEGLARSMARSKLPYLEVGRENLKGTLVSIPERAQIPLTINESIIMEQDPRYF